MSDRIPSYRGLVFAVTALLAACTTAQMPPPTLSAAEARRGCALGVAGATVSVEDTEGGIVLHFTSKERLQELRERGHDAAAQHGQGQRVGKGEEGGRHGSGGDHGLKMLQAPAARSVADDVQDGVRVRFVAVDPADTEVLRAKLRARADAMNSASSCT